MMKSAIDWLMRKSESQSVNKITPQASLISDSEITQNDKDSSKENSIFNGKYSRAHMGVASSYSQSPDFSRRQSSEGKLRSPWGQSLTPRTSKYISPIGAKHSPSNKISSIHGSSPHNVSPRLSWEDISFSSEVDSPGFASRIAKEGRGNRTVFDGVRRYPIGQEKFIRAGVLPNVKLKGRSKVVISAKRQPTSLLNVSNSPFSSTLATGFLASTSTRMSDISSVVSLLDSTPSTSACDTIKDPTSVQAVVEALEQAQSLKSGIKRSRYGEAEDTNKKQKFFSSSDSQNGPSEFSTPIMNQVFSTGMKRTLDANSSGSEGELTPGTHPQLSPENKRRCIPDPRIASFSSFKNIHNNVLNQVSGRETPYSLYESQQDSDSESNRSLESQHSRHSDKSLKGQSYDGTLLRPPNPEQADRSRSQTPQSQRGSYGIGRTPNGSSASSSRTTTPSSRLSHAFSLEAYKADKARSQQRLNKMLGMLFNVPEEEMTSKQIESITATSVVTSNSSSFTGPSATASPIAIVTEVPKNLASAVGDAPQPTAPTEKASNEVSSSFTFNIKSKQADSTPDVSVKESVSKESDNADSTIKLPSTTTTITSESVPQLPLYKEAVSQAASASISLPVSVSKLEPTSPSLFSFGSPAKLPSYKESSSKTIIKESDSTVTTTALSFPSFTSGASSTANLSGILKASPVSLIPTNLNLAPTGQSSNTTGTSSPLQALKETTLSIDKPPYFNLGSIQSPPISSPKSSTLPSSSSNAGSGLFTFGKTSVNSDSSNLVTTNYSTPFTSTAISSSEPLKASNLFSFASSAMPPKITEAETRKPPPASYSELPKSTTVANISSGSLKFGDTSNTTFFSKSSSLSNVPNQIGGTPMFTFGSGNGSAATVSTTTTTTTVASMPNLFSFGSSKTESSSGGGGPSFGFMKTPESSQNLTNVPKLDSGFTFSKSDSGFSFGSKKSSSIITTSAADPPNNTFGSSAPFSFGSSSATSSASQQPSQSQPTQSSATTGLFTFAAPNTSQKSSSPFTFSASATTTQSATIPTPQFNNSIGGGFSFGGTKPSSQPSVPQFGASSNKDTSASFSFNPASPSSSNAFSFGSSSTVQTLPKFGTPSTTSSGFGAPSSNKPATTFNFGPQTPPSFGSNSSISTGAKPAFGGSSNASSSNLFGSAPSASPFSSSQNPNPNPFNINPPAPSFGGSFGSSNTPSNPAAPISSPNPNPFQMGQSSNSTFAFGQSATQQKSPSNVFCFGSQPTSTHSPAPNFGAAPGTFNFGSGGAMTGSPNPFNVGTPPASETPSAPRRIKTRLHRRR